MKHFMQDIYDELKEVNDDFEKLLDIANKVKNDNGNIMLKDDLEINNLMTNVETGIANFNLFFSKIELLKDRFELLRDAYLNSFRRNIEKSTKSNDIEEDNNGINPEEFKPENKIEVIKKDQIQSNA